MRASWQAGSQGCSCFSCAGVRICRQTCAPASPAVRENDGASLDCLDDSPALLAWDQRYTLRQSSLQTLQGIARCARLPTSVVRSHPDIHYRCAIPL